MEFQTRYDLLKVLLARYDSYYNLSAVKASLLLTTNVIVLASFVDPGGHVASRAGLDSLAGVLLLGSAALTVFSAGAAVLVLASYLRTDATKAASSVIFSDHVAATGADDYLRKLEVVDEAGLLEDLARVVHHRAVGLSKKFRWINRSLWSFLAAVLLMAIVALIA